MPTTESNDQPLRSHFPVENPNPQGLGFRWDPAVATDAVRWPEEFGRRPPTEAANYNIRWQYLGDGEGPDPVKPEEWVSALDDPIAISPPAGDGEGRQLRPVRRGEDLCERFPVREPTRQSEFPADADMWVQHWVAEGWYAGGVQARDLFGRLSEWADGGPSLADSIPGPPPPTNINARLLQLDDPELTADQLALANVHGDGCIAVSWQWPPQMRRQAPHAASFRVYVKRAVFNQFSVRVVAVDPDSSPDWILCTVESDVALPADSLANSSLVDQGLVAFRIVANTGGITSVLSLQRRVDAARLPTKGDAEVRLIAQVPVKVTAATDGPAPDQITCEIQSRTALATGSHIDGTLSDESGIDWKILNNTDGTIVSLTLQRSSEHPQAIPAGKSTLSIAEANSLYQDPAETSQWEARVATVLLTSANNYQAVIPPVDIFADGARPIRRAGIGVSTADDSVRHDDTFVQPPGAPWDSTLGGLKGREGNVSPPKGVVTIFREPEPVPDPVEPDRVFSSPPDFYGNSRYELLWPNVSPARRRYTQWNVWRTTDLVLLGLFDPDPDQSRIDVSEMSAAGLAELQAAHAAGQVKLISDPVLQELAIQPNADQALVIANESPLQSSADEMVFADVLDGRNQVRYVYRLRTETKAGTLSPLSDVSLPVHVPNTYPPTPVRIRAVEGGERRVRLAWQPNSEPDLGGYLVFGSEGGLSEKELQQLRALRRPGATEQGTIEVYDRDGNLIQPTRRITKTQAESLLVDGEIVLVIEELPGGELFHYRLAAFDIAGNVSQWTTVFSARTTGIERPSPPAWNDPVLDGDSLNLSWQSSHSDLNCLVQKQIDDGPWTNLTGWLGRGNYAAVITGDHQSAGMQLRLRVMFPNGQINKDFNVLDLEGIVT